MQTFLPFANFQKTAQVLDHYNCGPYSRLWKQVVEAKQLICSIQANDLPQSWIDSKSYSKQGWRHHPVYKMWVHHPELLKHYYNILLDYCIEVKGIKTVQPYLSAEYENEPLPWWLGNEDFHRSHRARLIEKGPEYYGLIFPNDIGFNDSKYLWPNDDQTFRII